MVKRRKAGFLKKSSLFLFLLFLLILFLGCATKKNMLQVGDNVKNMKLKTKDGISIAATFYDAKSAKGVILLHMLNKNRATWDSFARELLRNNYSAISVDFRGHGESDLDISKFSDEDFNNMQLDVDAAREYLASQNINETYLVGASIGANIALNYAANNEENVNGVVLLSPGLNYHEVKTQKFAGKYSRSMLIVVSREDKYAYDSSQEIIEISNVENKEIKIYKNAGHGTDMFKNTELNKLILEWLEGTKKLK